jgi:hypothetical protein
VPAWRRPLLSRRSGRDNRQQRQDDSNQWKHEARHKRTIDGRLLGGDSNLSAQSSATASGSLAKRLRKFVSPQLLTQRGHGLHALAKRINLESGGERPYSALMPANLITLAHFSVASEGANASSCPLAEIGV